MDQFSDPRKCKIRICLCINTNFRILEDGQMTPMDTDQPSSVLDAHIKKETHSNIFQWIHWFCSSKKHRYYTEVDESFIEDPFNLIGLNQFIPLYKETLEILLDLEPDDAMYNRVPDLSLLEPSAELLYGLIHQRYILTKQGMLQMVSTFLTTK